MTKIAVLGWIAPFLVPVLVGCGGAAPPPVTPSEASGGYAVPAAAPATVQAEPPSGREEIAMADSDGAAAAKGESAGFASQGTSAGGSNVPARPPAPPPAPAQTAAKKGPDAPKDESTEAAPHDGAMLIYTAHVTMAVYQVEPGLAAVEQIAKDLGGYLATRNDTEITVRIPRARFDEAMRRVGLTGDVIHRDVSAEDVTDEVVDLEVRLKNARNMRDRLAELLTKADAKAALEIEKELGRVTGEIERMEGRLKVLHDKIAYSSITVTFQARGPGALREVPLRLPFPWLSELGLPRLLSLHE